MALLGKIKKFFEPDNVIETDYFQQMMSALGSSLYYRSGKKSRELINGILTELGRVGKGKDCKKNQEICAALLAIANEIPLNIDHYNRLRFLCLGDDKIQDREKQPALYKALNKGWFTNRAFKNIRDLIDRLDKEPNKEQENIEAKKAESGTDSTLPKLVLPTAAGNNSGYRYYGPPVEPYGKVKYWEHCKHRVLEDDEVASVTPAMICHINPRARP